jgi:hypothetical protein
LNLVIQYLVGVQMGILSATSSLLDHQQGLDHPEIIRFSEAI